MASQPLTANHLNTRLPSKTHPIILRTIQLSDAPLHAALISSPANGGDDPGAAALTPERSRELIAAQRRDAATPTVLGGGGTDGRPQSGPPRLNMVVCLSQQSGEGDEVQESVIGLGGFGAIKDWDRDGRRVRAGDVGVLLDAQVRGRGYAVEAMRLAIGWAFTPVSEGGPQLDLVTITTDEDNVPMLKLVDEKLGLGGRGVLRPHEFAKDKQEAYYEITAEEWSKINLSGS